MERFFLPRKSLFLARCLVALGAFLAFAAPARATTYYVHGGCGSNGNNGLGGNCSDSVNRPFATIQKAVDAAASGDIVKIIPYNYDAANLYSITRYAENLVVPSDITLEVETMGLPLPGSDCGSWGTCPEYSWWLVIDGDTTPVTSGTLQAVNMDTYVDPDGNVQYLGYKVTLGTNASSVTGFYNGMLLTINGATPRENRVQEYNGGTKVATVYTSYREGMPAAPAAGDAYTVSSDKIGDNGNATIYWSGTGGTLRNLTVEGGYGQTGDDGAGILISGEGTGLTLENLYVQYNDNGIAVHQGAAPVIKHSTICYNQKSGIVVQDTSAPIIGGNGNKEGYNTETANWIYYNGTGMSYEECGISYSSPCGADPPAGCAAVAVSDAATPKIWGNKLEYNLYTGLSAKAQSNPSVKGNYIKGNVELGLGLFSVEQGIDISGNVFYRNGHGIGIQSSGAPCNRIRVKDNVIRKNSGTGILSCNSYVQIGGSAGEGNNIYGNKVHGICLSAGSEGEVSYNNIANNSWIGVHVYDSLAVIEKNLVADNGSSYLANDEECGQIEFWSSTAQRVNSNLIVGGHYTQSGFDVLGVLAGDKCAICAPTLIEEIRDNIIYRAGLGIKLSDEHTPLSYRPGSIDRNLVMQWNGSLDTDSDTDGYLLGEGNRPGENTYYYGQETGSYGNPPAYLFSDPDHEDASIYPDFAPVFGNPLDGFASLGLPADFVYIDATSNFNYKFQSTLSGLAPSLDSTPPAVTKVIPDGTKEVSTEQTIIAYLQDTGDGIDGSSVSLSLSGGAGECNPCTITTSGNSSYLKVVYEPPVSLDSATTYSIDISAGDVRGNSLSYTPTTFTTSGSEESIPPYIPVLDPADGSANVAVNSAIWFEARDDASGIDPESIQLFLDNTLLTPLEKTPLEDGGGVGPDYFVYYKPTNNLPPNTTINLTTYVQDCAGNSQILESSFTTGEDLDDTCDTCPNDPYKDIDGDGICGDVDNCPTLANPDQADTDGDGWGNACDTCFNDSYNDIDGDGICGDVDNCPTLTNPDQADADGDGLGDACDGCNGGVSGSILALPDVLWSPNHQMFAVSIDTSNLVAPNPEAQISITSVEIKEPSRETGENIYTPNGHEPDFEINQDLSLNLRSERSGESEYRIYTITVTVADCSGSHDFTATVTVPHDENSF